MRGEKLAGFLACVGFCQVLLWFLFFELSPAFAFQAHLIICSQGQLKRMANIWQLATKNKVYKSCFFRQSPFVCVERKTSVQGFVCFEVNQ